MYELGGVAELLVFELTDVYCISADGISCYSCHSAEPGCGKELSIRLERWHSCPDVAAGGGENFCVKLIEKRGSKYIVPYFL